MKINTIFKLTDYMSKPLQSITANMTEAVKKHDAMKRSLNTGESSGATKKIAEDIRQAADAIKRGRNNQDELNEKFN